MTRPDPFAPVRNNRTKPTNTTRPPVPATRRDGWRDGGSAQNESNPEQPLRTGHDLGFPLFGDPADFIASRDDDGESARAFIRHMVAEAAPWRLDALCAEFDVDLWFPTRGQSNQPAIDICGRCSVRQECLDEALDDKTLDYGIRGAMTANARKQARRTR